ncbi:succinate dehydrogenase, cytochrome b556 subunit [Acuticoccus sp. I52.16.1]|uniref:succinate dehydrogenase, cytochrome b556 subunit n=1 Tax=Acuticoccus sp. I52.16.1 TaxID=2928472 RepID=UPI001FD34BAB|nr:succinate dehydrogenase, cytochrome b556 subunit [Acuticoccus sp. I52.16.1]UOM36362.1 succinate dehydrogenase, cytochrome b556 subunit [Acuticoccus sp. I52.16.1]
MASADTEVSRRPRPLSPHLSIYRPIVTMVMSIMHRVTGMMNVAGLVLVVIYLLALAGGPESYEWANGIYSSWLGRIVLVAFTWSLIHHMLGGIRHFVWDTGHGFGDVRYDLARLTIFGSIILTTALWSLIVVLEVI